MSLENIPVGAIKPNPKQPRNNFNMVKLQELADTMREEGQLQPIEVERNGVGWILHHGERRLRAAQILGWETIQAVVAAPQDDQTLLIRALIENVQREDMNPIEEARAYEALNNAGLSWNAIAKRVGKSTTHITLSQNGAGPGQAQGQAAAVDGLTNLVRELLELGGEVHVNLSISIDLSEESAGD